MVLLISLATAAPLVFHASASVSRSWVVNLEPGELGRGGGSRMELGAGSERFQVFGLGQIHLHDVGSTYGVDSLRVFDDVLRTDVGAGVRMPWRRDAFRVVPRAALGVAFLDTPVEESVVAESGLVTMHGPHGRGVWAQGGLDAGWDVQDRGVLLFVGADLGYLFLSGLGLVPGIRAGGMVEF